ncbi:hypothetical protein [Cellulomonas xylanilytica]|uniref:Uncharacterized protein n=1 Tax=Cellulomonas xylanilytica TaxID=233583 RepID=A0A510V2I2_9CELL|nr:hypothetical protein [Cellulomonas xylanilytica]GEK21068.1 hypothetical protein CXY01_15880 [Cellulomonas xylanilytica]
MLTELESRLADVLGAALPAPFGGRVRRLGAPAPAGPGPVVRLGVQGWTPLEPDVFSTRPELGAGAPTLRRVVRLRVDIGLDVATDPPGDRLGELAGADALLYALQDPGVRTATALVAPGDQGFRLDSLELAPVGEQDDDPDVLVRAEGWFWPVGVPGQEGREIARALVREVRLPVRLLLGAALEAGGPEVTCDLVFGATGTLDVSAGPAVAAPFGAVALRVLDAGGGPGVGVLGADGSPSGSTVVAVVEGAGTTFTYTPPAAAAREHLVVLAHAGDGGDARTGMELARFELVTP